MKLDLNDLQPVESELKLSNGSVVTLKKVSLATQIWINQRFGVDGLEGIFKNSKIPEISEIAYYLIKEKTTFPTLLDFQEAIVTQMDRVNLMQSILNTIGISQPLLEKMAVQENAGKLEAPIGASTTTSSPPSTATP